ncbi:nodulation protein NodH [Flavimaricola marinus]|nr:nodulation protein NodH [Flavimaricola marinus]
MSRFDYFIVFADMRTGSNFLEANLNAFDGVSCLGEAFNPHFIGYPNSTEVLGITQAQRDSDPARLISAVKAEGAGRPSVIAGFRYFNDHDPRVMEMCLPDPRCAKIVLTRNPVESYVSRKIAAATGQWKLTNVKHAKSETIRFEPGEFARHLDALQAFQVRILNGLQRTGQTAFYVDYEDLQDVEVMNGLAAWLGIPARIEGLNKKLKKQNPEPLSEKVQNFDEMETALARADRFNLTRTPNFEPRRGPAIPTYVAAPKTPLLYLPLRSGPEAAVRDWLVALDGGAALHGKFTNKTLRQWMGKHPGHRSFTVLRHPVARAHAAFCERILPASGAGTFPELRQNLRRQFNLPLPEGDVGEDYGTAEHRAAFLSFLSFLKPNLGGQTNLRIDPAWASQGVLLQGMSGFAPPDMILREDSLGTDLAYLARQVGRDDAPAMTQDTDPHHYALAKVYDADIEKAARDAYGRDYEMFGFSDWG